jgi:molybdopterin-guanine dinucleotide biosynthesis protein A
MYGDVMAVVLAGGASRRMGRDKATLLLPDGRTTIQAIVDAARAVTPHVLLSVDSAAHGNGLLQAFSDPPVLLVDADPGAGPLAALATAMQRAANYRAVLVLATDTPLVRPALLRLLCATIRPGDSIGAGDTALDVRGDGTSQHANLAVPVIGGVVQPMPGLYGCTLLGTAQALLAQGRRSLRSLIESSEATTHLIGEQAMRDADPSLLSFVTANTPDEWEALSRVAAEQANDP